MARNTPAKIIYPLPHRSSRTRPPSEIVELNRNSPQANGLKFWAPLNTPEYKEIISGLSPSFGSSGKPSFIIDPVWGGYAYHYTDDSSSDHRLIYDNMSVWTNNVYHASLSVWVRSSITTWSSTFYFMLLGMSGWSGDRAIRLRLEQTVPRFVLDVSNDGEDPGAASIEYDFSTLTQYVWYHLVGTWNSGADRMRLYIDGVKVNEEGSVETGPMYATTADFTLLGHNDAASNATARLQGIRDARYYDRELSEAEVWDMYSNPWSIYKPTQPRFYSIPPKQEEGSSVIPVSNLMGWNPRGHAINTAFELNRDSPLADGLVFWLPLSDQSLQDKVGKLDLTKNNSPIFVPSEKGWVMEFDDASSQYLIVSSSPVSAVPITISAWAWTDSDALQQRILTVSDGGSDYCSISFNGNIPADPIRAHQSGTSVEDAQTSTGYSTNTWHHICASFVGTNNRTVYIDGGSKGNDTTDCGAQNSLNTVIVASGSPVANYLSGGVAEAAIWNRALSDAEVLELYKNPWTLYKPYTPQFWSFPPAPKEPSVAVPFVNTWKHGHAPNTAFELNRDSPLANGLVFWLPLSDQSLQDKVGKLDLTKNNSPIFVPSEKGWVMEFDDASSEWLINSSFSSVTDLPLTLACWFNVDVIDIQHTLIYLGSNSDSEWHRIIVYDSNLIRVDTRLSDFSYAWAYTTSPSVQLNTWHSGVGVVAADDDRRAYMDGGQKGTGSTSKDAGLLDSIRIGATGGATELSGKLFNACIWNRALSDAEVLEFHRNPWTLYKPIRPQFWSLPIAGVGHPTALRYIYTPGSRQWTPAQLGR